ncbi:MAG: septal ring lytic transglycosylase RlpA family protein [Candidatus Sericytochromatia bacterium]
MTLQSLLFSLVLTGALASPVGAATAPRPIFGHISQNQNCTLTVNGQQRLVFSQVPAAIRPAIQEDLGRLARRLNRLSQAQPIQAAEIEPVLENGEHEIRYRNQLLLRLGQDWSQYRKQSRLATLLDVTNQLRTKLGAQPLRNFDTLNSQPDQVGMASWYGGFFHGRRTANGERYNVHQYTAAHKKLPFGSRVLVTNLNTKQSVIVKINDRGPFVSERIIDLSPAAFKHIGYLGQGVLKVKITVLS